MQFQGLNLQGIGYGQLSPKDFAGLKLWLKPDVQNFVLARGNLVGLWKDSSGNDRHWVATSTPLRNNAYWGYYLDRQITGSSGSLVNSCSDGYYNFLVNGSAFSVIILSYGHSASLVTTTLNASAGALYSFGPDATSSPQMFRLTSYAMSNAGTGAANRITNQTFTTNSLGQRFKPSTISRPGVLAMHTCYGAAAAAPQHAIFNNERAVPDYTTTYQNLPSPNNAFGNGMTLSFSMPASSLNRVFEVIMYDHTGKTRERIDAEMLLLRTAYFQSVYKGIEQANTAGSVAFLVNSVAKNANGTQLTIVMRYSDAGVTGYTDTTVTVNYTARVVISGAISVVNGSFNMGPGSIVTTQQLTIPGGTANLTSATISGFSFSPSPANGVTVVAPQDFTQNF